MRLLAEAAREVELTKAQIKYYEKVMSNGQVFKRWTKNDKPGVEELVLAFKYEMTRPRVRLEIFKRLIQLYNVHMAQQNWLSANDLYAEKTR